MVTRPVVFDDFDGSLIGEHVNAEVRFSIDGQAYAVDLTEENADAFRRLLLPYIEVGRQLDSDGATPANLRVVGNERQKRRQQGPSANLVRAWAKDNGWPDIAEHGRIPADIMAAYKARPPADESPSEDGLDRPLEG